MTICNYFLWFLAYSLFGWVYESVYCSIVEKKWVNRGFLSGPICPIYGAGAVLFLLMLQSIASPVLIFLVGMISASLLEYVTSWVLEALFHTRWWDYENFRFNLNGRICLLGALVFGAFAVVLLKWVHPLVSRATEQVPEQVRWILAAVLLAVLLVDGLVTLARLIHFTNRLAALQAAMNQFVKGAKAQAEHLWTSFSRRLEESLPNAERIRALLQSLTAQEKRLLRAFPKVRSLRFNEALLRIKQRHAFDRPDPMESARLPERESETPPEGMEDGLPSAKDDI